MSVSIVHRDSRRWQVSIRLMAVMTGIGSLLFLGACSVSPTHPALKSTNLPPLVPVRAFTANIDYTGGYRVSPDGSKLLWSGVSLLRPALYWRDLNSGQSGVQRFKKRTPRAFWASDSKHILYHLDASGRENHQVYAWNTRSGKARPLTPGNGTKAWVEHVPRTVSDVIFVAHNARDPEWFDLYRHNLETNETTPIAQNLDSVVRRLLDDDGREILRQRLENDHYIAEVREGDTYREVLRHDRFTDWYPFEITPDGSTAYTLSNRDRDRLALVTTDLTDGSETVLFEHPRVDVGNVWMDPGTRKPMYYQTYDGYPADVVLDDALNQLLEPLRSDEPFGININSLSRDRSTGTVTRYDHTGSTYYLIEGGGKTLTELGQSPSRKRADIWTEVEPFSIPARDGLELHGYLTRPAQNAETAKPLPTVLYVHGGPWARDYWGHDDFAQMLSNRGYAVLRVNYRGSSGYGRGHRDAAKGEFAGKMHTDLLDAVDWAVAEGISDPDKIGIFGGSYGGYATLVGLTMTPDRFACGVDFVGVSDLATLLEDAPPYWRPFMPFWHAFAGDPAIPEQREELNKRSPLYHADKLQSPLLIIHGRNDPRVKLDQSERMVAALRAAGKTVTFKSVADEGHGFQHWKNRTAMFRQVEDFFANCLGGRSSGFELYSLGAWAF